MGRYISGSDQPRRQLVRLTASAPTQAIPSWATVVYISGCGGGGSGGLSSTTTEEGGGGGSGGYATNLLARIPTGITTMNVTVGAGGAAVTSTIAATGNSGGTTSIAMSGYPTVTLTGGAGGTGAGSGGAAGRAFLGAALVATLSQVDVAGLSLGATGRNGTLGLSGEGGQSPYGSLGAEVYAPDDNHNGSDAAGYGAGGSGGNNTSGTSRTSGAGAPGFVVLEFVEAV